jgi:hypothetical protein
MWQKQYYCDLKYALYDLTYYIPVKKATELPTMRLII